MKCKTNYKSEDGKCVKRKGLFGNGKKSYNPFKMWGAWVGLVYGIVSGFFYMFEYSISAPNSILPKIFLLPGFLPDILVRIIFVGGLEGAVSHGVFGILIGMPLSVVFGFLIGWGIHSLVRRIRK